MYTPRFITPLRFEDDGPRRFVLTSALTYVTDVEHFGTFSVPAGYGTDGASVPRPFWNLFPPIGGTYDAAAVLHDKLYRDGEFKNGLKCTRADADAVLYEAMGVLNTNRFTRWSIYAGVRAGGWATWNGYRAKERQ